MPFPEGAEKAGIMGQAKIMGTGSSAPERILSNKDLERIVDTSDEWIVRRTGIRERRIASKERAESTTDLASQAASKAMEMAGVTADQMDMIVVGTVTPDRQFPSVACMLQHVLGAEKAAAFDISAGCSGFLYALSVVENAIRCGTAKTALVVGVERLSTILNWTDRSTCVLLGDGAGAVVIKESSNGRGIMSTHLRSNGAFGDLLYSEDGNTVDHELLKDVAARPFHLCMDGNKLFKRAVECLSTIATEALVYNGLTHEDLDLVIPHQANIRIIQAAAKSLGISMEKVYVNVDRYGNTSSASIPIALDEANRAGLLRKDARILLISFGAGLTWGASILKW
jgi:3-oxoacyl-[acyl-carrier-protein] synthase III